MPNCTEDKRKRILIVEEQVIMRQGIKLLVNQESDLAVCGEVGSPSEAMKAIEQLHPDIVIIAMKETSVLDLIKEVRAAYPQLLMLVLSMRYELFLAERVLRAGARGLIAKEDGTVVEGIRKILAGHIYVSEKMASMIIQAFAGAAPSAVLLHNLTDRELEVFELIGHGLTRREIAKRLHLSVKTIGSHREHIKEKLNLDTSTDLLKHAIEWTQMPRGEGHGGGEQAQGGDGAAEQGDGPLSLNALLTSASLNAVPVARGRRHEGARPGAPSGNGRENARVPVRQNGSHTKTRVPS